jgi:hypothetical protein
MTIKWITMLAAFAALHLLQAMPVRAIRPDPRLTPGMASTASAADVCRPGFAQRMRAVPESIKRQVYSEYDVLPNRGERFEIDHLVPLELGGANDKRNLWPQPFAGTWTAGQKDRLENALHWDVCRGREPLEQAQDEIRQDWIGAYQRHFGPKGGMTDGG